MGNLNVVKNYEPDVPLDNLEVYEMVGKLTNEELGRNYLNFNGASRHTSTITLGSDNGFGGLIHCRHPSESKIPFVIATESEHDNTFLRHKLQDLLGFSISEVPQEALV